MKELVNFSAYQVDLERFSHDWDKVRSFCEEEGLDGIELLIGDDSLPDAIPAGLIESVHLPGWFGWVRTWREPHTVPQPCDPLETAWYYGAENPENLLFTFRKNLDRAESLQAAYAVFHISHVELPEVYTRSHRYRSRDVLETAASFLNAVCSGYPGGEPPVTLAFENLWWPGLTFLSDEDTRFFADLLRFRNWIFLLDTGHLMNAMAVHNEQEGIRNVLKALDLLSDITIEKIKAVHLQCSTPGTYLDHTLPPSPPPGFDDMTYLDKISCLMDHIPHIDEHRPFSDPDCGKILACINPDRVVHEFITRSREELQSSIRQQRGLMRHSC